FERSARQIVKLADALQAKALEQPRDVAVEAQGLDGQWRQDLRDLSLRDDEGRDPPVARKRMSASQGLGKGEPRAEAETGEALRHAGKEGAGAPKEMRHAWHVEPQPIIAVDIERGAIAA